MKHILISYFKFNLLALVWPALLLQLFLLSGMSSLSQSAVINGCTDPAASNYNRNATVTDGSCIYKKSSLRPQEASRLTDTLNEVSGMEFWKGRWVMHNDGGHPNILYMVDTSTGRIVQEVILEGATNVDWEDMAQDSSHFYIGDFGNNGTGIRRNLVIYKVPKASIGAGARVVVLAADIQRIQFSYPEQTTFETASVNNTQFDCEAMIALRGKLHIFTKNWIGLYSVHYTLPTEPGEYVAQRIDSLQTVNYMITGAASAANDLVLLTGYTKTGICGLVFIFGFNDSDSFFKAGNARFIRLPPATTVGQLESVCFANATRGWLASERFAPRLLNVRQRVLHFSSLPWIVPFYKSKSNVVAAQGNLRYNRQKERMEIHDGIRWLPARL